jgi:hypothetical protein
MDKYKTVKEKRDLYIDFSEEEIAEMGWKDNQKVSLKVHDDGSILVEPYKTIELDIDSWDPSVFKMLVVSSMEQDKTVNDVIVDLISKSLNSEYKTSEPQLICENGII